jgi:D-alanyl-D-alanine endopeptidase (penicillin-binding protein 7)
MKKIIITLLALLISCTAVEAKTKKHHSIYHKQHAVYKQGIKKTQHAQRVFTSIIVPGGTEALLYDITNNQVIKGSVDDEPMSIASISKLMTVYTVLVDEQNLDQVLTVPRVVVPHTRLRAGMELTRRDLIQLALVSSDNLAAHTLAYHGRGGWDGFITRMNLYAQHLGMTNTGFVEATGLSASNQSSVKDLIILTNEVMKFPEVRLAASSDYALVRSSFNHRQVSIRGTPTNKMFGQDGVRVIKTGFTNAAGFCIAMIVEKNNKLYNIIILGSRSKYERERIVNSMLSNIT